MADKIAALETSLNPFEFRAGLKLDSTTVDVFGPLSLNPFEFRAGLKRYTRKKVSTFEGLNPFEFRAGLKPFG